MGRLVRILGYCERSFLKYFVVVCCVVLTDADSTRNIHSDLRQMTMVTSTILILREGNSPDWTNDLDTQMNNWTTNYINWLTTSPIATGEQSADKYVFLFQFDYPIAFLGVQYLNGIALNLGLSFWCWLLLVITGHTSTTNWLLYRSWSVTARVLLIPSTSISLTSIWTR